jgi:hypothetical protein
MTFYYLRAWVALAAAVGTATSLARAAGRCDMLSFEVWGSAPVTGAGRRGACSAVRIVLSLPVALHRCLSTTHRQLLFHEGPCKQTTPHAHLVILVNQSSSTVAARACLWLL